MSRAERMAERAPDIGALTYTIKADHEFEDYSERKGLGRFRVTPAECLVIAKGGDRESSLLRALTAQRAAE